MVHAVCVKSVLSTVNVHLIVRARALALTRACPRCRGRDAYACARVRMHMRACMLNQLQSMAKLRV